MGNVKERRTRDSGYAEYRKKATQRMRPYVPGEDMTGISVSSGDVLEEGGMVAVNRDNPTDRWYVSKEFFEANYERVNDECEAAQ